MGTTSFDGAFPGMRKAQDFIIYPLDKAGTEISIQSEHRYGKLDLDTGKGVLSANKAQYANSVWLALCMCNGTAKVFQLTPEDLQALRKQINSTGGDLVGKSFVKSCNIGALAIV